MSVGSRAREAATPACVYDAASRLQSVSAGGNRATYSYVANSPLVSQIGFTNNGAGRMTTTKQYDFLNRLGSIASSGTGFQPVSFAYQYNAANQRTRATLADGSYWLYGYDELGQVTSAKRYWYDGTPVAGQHNEYGFDDIGNRASARWGGDTNGATLLETSYAANLLNQYTSVVTPGYKAVLGAALATNAVTVNSGATTRKGEYFHRELTIANGSGPVWQGVTVSSAGSSVTGNVLFPPNNQSPTYDTDGNLTADGLWTYTWDGENRLLSVTSQSTVPAAARVKLEFAYDHKGRRIQKVVSRWNGSAYVPQSTNRFVYDGWNLVAILAPDSSLLTSFLWGSDLSGSLQGAGGVGGLLTVTVHAGANAGTYFPAYDGNGNVMALVNAAGGSAAAQYEYDAFGGLLRAAGPLAQANPFLFSTKFHDWETGLYYYGYRYYDPVAGRWPSRDPIEERGGRNLYASFRNNPVNQVDFRGLDIVCSCAVEQYFAEHGITSGMWVKKAEETYSANPTFTGEAPGSGVGEILWKMLQDERTFTALARSVKQLKLHVAARQNVVKATGLVTWAMPYGDRREVFNPRYWEGRLLLKSGVPASEALQDVFSCPSCYETGCNAASELVLLKGILDAIGPKLFDVGIDGQPTRFIDGAAIRSGLVHVQPVAAGGQDPTLKNWVPGDRGYVRGTGTGLDAGEWIIYLGNGNRFWGFQPGDDNRVRSIEQWVKDMGQGGDGESGKRMWPGVGLEKQR